VAIYKTVRSRSPLRTTARERLYIIESANFAGLAIYTKGKFVTEAQRETLQTQSRRWC
jgi:hypothetical protein